MLDNLPTELLFNIFSLLQPKDAIRCMCVSKAWNAAIRDPRFIKAHHQRSMKTDSCRTLLLSSATHPNLIFLPLDENDTIGTAVEIGIPPPMVGKHFSCTVGYCNGLVCIRNYLDALLALWNPFIEKFKKIPFTTSQLLPSKKSKGKSLFHGFGFDSTNDDYKIVEIVEFYEYGDEYKRLVDGHEVRIYSLQSNSWKRIESMPCNGCRLTRHSVFLNNSLSWKMHQLRCRNIILTLDLATEKYRELPITFNVNVWSIHLLGEYLCICDCEYNSYRHNVWIMKEFGVTDSWTLLFSVDFDSITPFSPGLFMEPVMFSKNGQMVLLDLLGKLVWFDLKKTSPKLVEIHGIPDHNRVKTVCEGLGSLCLFLDGDPVIRAI